MQTIRKGEIPAVVLLMPFVAGITAGFCFNSNAYTPFLFIALLTFGSAFIILNLYYNYFNLRHHSWIGGICIHLILIVAGWLSTVLHNELNMPTHFSRSGATSLVIRVASEPKQTGQFHRFSARVQQCIKGNRFAPVQGSLLVTLVADSNSHPVDYGDVLLIPANFKSVDPPFNPAEFNYKRYLAYQSIYYQTFITKKELIKIKTHQGNPLIYNALHIRRYLVDKFKTYIPDPEAAAVASTLILGYKAELSSDILQAYSKTGTIHVLSVSGAHVLVIFAFINFSLRLIRHKRYGKLAGGIISMILIWCYALLTGFSPAVSRAALMITMLIIGRLANRHVNSLNSLAVSAFILLMYDPFMLMDVGFQLSYLAVFGLIAIQPVIYKQFEFKYTFANKLWYLLSASLAAQLITFPLSAYYFHQFPVYFLVSNLLIIIPSEIIMITGLIFSAFSGIDIIAKPLGYLLEHFILLMNNMLSYIEHLPFASIGQLWYPGMQWLLWYALIIFAIIYLMNKKAWQLLGGLGCMLILSICTAFTSIDKHTSRHIIYFNVKQHTAMLFQYGYKAVVITDLAVNDKNYAYSIQPCMDSLQVAEVVVLKPEQNYKNDYFNKQLNYIQFFDQSIIVFNKQLQNKSLKYKLKADQLLLTDNPSSSLKFIDSNYRYNTLILNANNSIPRIKSWLHEADSLNLKIKNLKRNKALVITSK